MEERLTNLERVVSNLLYKTNKEISSNILLLVILIIGLLFGVFAFISNGRYHDLNQRMGFLEDKDILQDKIKAETYDQVIKGGR